MDTRLKKSKLYSTKSKAVACIIFFISILVIYLCGVIFTNVSANWQFSIVNSEEYFDTESFIWNFDRHLDDVVETRILYLSEDNIEAGNVVPREALIESFKSYYGIIDGVITQNTLVNSSYDGLIILKEIPENLEDNFEEYKMLVEQRLPQYRKMYIQNQLEEYRRALRELDNSNNFKYYLEDENGIKIAGNTSKEEISEYPRLLVLEGGFSSGSVGKYSDYHNYVLEQSGCKLYGAIQDPLIPNDIFYQENQDFAYARDSFPPLIITSGVAFVVMILTVLYLIRVTGQKEHHGEVSYSTVDRIYNDIHVLMTLAASTVFVFISIVMINNILYQDISFWTYIFSTVLGGVIMIESAVCLSFVLSMVRQIKGNRLFSHTVCGAIIRKIGSLCSGKTFQGWTVFVVLIYGAINCFLALWFYTEWIYRNGMMAFALFVVWALFNIVSVYLCIRGLNSLSKIMVSAHETSRGNLSYKLDISKISPSFINFATDVANIQNGLKEAVEDAVKGERMKAELITNVSHDLKTPLTSIITYADILKKENLENEKAEGYVEILYDKSYRLKQLIEDLIEASKASSGNLTVNKERVELKQLLMQAIGEMEEKIEKAGLVFKISCERETAVFADGRHMWRIAENLLSNAIKYSMPNSRVYIDIMQTSDTGVLVVKNISEAAIEVNVEQLTERFVRGDESRTTEGSGLGLSIAKSLSELQNGQLEISVDGDLFKAVVKMPLWIEPEGEEQETTQE